MANKNQLFYTQCPHCRTLFRVILDIDNWAKCGHCKKVFDSRENEIDPGSFATENSELAQKPELSSFDVVSENLTARQKKSEIELDKISTTVLDGICPEKANTSAKKVDKKFESEKQETTSTQPSLFNERQLSSVRLKTVTQDLITSTSSGDLVKRARKITDERRLKSTQFSDQKHDQSHDSELKVESSKLQDGESFNNTQLKPDPQKTRKGKPSKPARTKKSKWAMLILAQAQNWKKEKNQFKSKRNYAALLSVLCLVSLLIWQVVVVNYTKLAGYSFLSAPLNLTCTIFSCNEKQLSQQNAFDILHANVRRHPTLPGVITVSANLINYSNSDQAIPKVRLDISDISDVIIASKSINLVNNPQYSQLGVAQLSPGQDIKIAFNIDQPARNAAGFELNIVSN